MANLTETEQMVLMALWSFSNPKSDLFPTVVPAWIVCDRAEELNPGLEIKTMYQMYKILDSLRAKGFIEVRYATVDECGEQIPPLRGWAPTQKTIDMDMEILDEY